MGRWRALVGLSVARMQELAGGAEGSVALGPGDQALPIPGTFTHGVTSLGGGDEAAAHEVRPGNNQLMTPGSPATVVIVVLIPG